MHLYELKGLTVISTKSYRPDRRVKKGLATQYILFSDKKTYIELEEQDYHCYHDCDPGARVIVVREDPKRWKVIYDDNEYYPEANYDIDF